MLLTKGSLQTKRHNQTESERMKNMFYTNGKDKKARVSILTADKVDFKTKSIKKDK